MQIGFGILLEDEAHNFARNIELELCEKFNLCWGLKQSPHITIKGPFETDKLEPFIDYVQDLAKTIRPFKIELEGINYFEGKSNVIILGVKKNKKLTDIQTRIISDLRKKFKIKPYPIELDGWKFHSTLATRDVSKEKLMKAKKYLKKYNPKFSFLARTIGVFYYLGEDAGWIIIRRINLKP